MKVLPDHNVARPLARSLAGHDVGRAAELGWSELKNGALLSAAEDAGFDVLLSGDKTMRHEQNMKGRRIAVISMTDHHWSIVQDHVDGIRDAVGAAKPGTVSTVWCGAFVPRRFRREPDARQVGEAR